MEIGSHFRGSISSVMAKKSTEIKFKYKIAVNGIFLKNTTNVSWGQNAKGGLILKKMAFG